MSAHTEIGWKAGSLADNLVVALRNRLDETGVSQADLAFRAGVSEKHLSQMLNRRVGGSVDTWDRLFVALDVSVRLCLANGWGVGTRLAGDEGYGETVIEITYMSERTLLAKRISNDGVATFPHETSWSLDCREWHEVTADAAEAVSE